MASAVTNYQVLTRNPIGNEGSNTASPALIGPYQFYEQTYTSTGVQESLMLPDAGSVGIVLSGSGSWVATIEATDSPPDVVIAGNGVWYAWPQGTQTATTANAVLTGATAVRANVTTVGTNVKISVRC